MNAAHLQKKVPAETVTRDERKLCVFGNKVKALGFRSYGVFSSLLFFFFFCDAQVHPVYKTGISSDNM